MVSCNISDTSPCTNIGDEKSPWEKLKRIDFLGAELLASSIVSGLLALDLGGTTDKWLSSTVLSLVATSIVLGIGFVLVEAYWAREPVFPLRLLRNRHVVSSYVNLGAQTAAQIAVSFLHKAYILT
jgi:hypothetical protein